MPKIITLTNIEITEIVLTQNPLKASVAYKVLTDTGDVYGNNRVVLSDTDLSLAKLNKVFEAAATKVGVLENI